MTEDSDTAIVNQCEFDGQQIDQDDMPQRRWPWSSCYFNWMDRNCRTPEELARGETLHLLLLRVL